MQRIFLIISTSPPFWALPLSKRALSAFFSFSESAFLAVRAAALATQALFLEAAAAAAAAAYVCVGEGRQARGIGRKPILNKLHTLPASSSEAFEAARSDFTAAATSPATRARSPCQTRHSVKGKRDKAIRNAI